MLDRRHFNKGYLGYSLLEVLVSLLVLSVGLLGMAALQTFGLKANHASLERTQATVLIQDIADRMLTNRDGVVAGNYDAVNVSHSTSPPGYGGCPTNCASASDLANFHIAEWIARLNAPGYLARGSLTIQRQVGATGFLYDITLRWQEGDLNVRQQVMARIL